MGCRKRKSNINTVSARFFYRYPTIHDGSTAIQYGGAHDASTIRYSASTIQDGSVTISALYCIRDESGWIWMNRGVSDTPTNDNENTYSATRNKPDSATVERQFRPRPQSTTICLKCFKWFKMVVVEVPESPRFFMNHYGTTTIHAYESTVLLRIMLMHHDLMNRV